MTHAVCLRCSLFSRLPLSSSCQFIGLYLFFSRRLKQLPPTWTKRHCVERWYHEVGLIHSNPHSVGERNVPKITYICFVYLQIMGAPQTPVEAITRCVEIKPLFGKVALGQLVLFTVTCWPKEVTWTRNLWIYLTGTPPCSIWRGWILVTRGLMAIISGKHSGQQIRNHLNTLRPKQIGRLFPDDIFKCIFLNENV